MIDHARYAPLLLLATACATGGGGTPADSSPARTGVGVATLPAVRAGCPALPVMDSVGLLSDVFRLADDSMRGRHLGSLEGAKARDYLAARFDALGIATIAPGRLHRVPVIPAPRNNNVDHAFNVIGVVRGTVQPEQYIVITAHYDHVGIGRVVDGDSLYNGADDNASGAAALVTLARHFQQARPRHSIVFAAVDGEERGMPGSRGFVDAPTVPLGQILVNVNLDMIGRNAKGEVYAAGPGKYPQLRPLVEATAACSPVTTLLGHDTPAAGPGNDWTNQSDQGSFHRKGIPFVYFGVEDHPDYHKPSDTPERLMPGFYVGVVRTVADFVRRFDETPVARTPATP
jgi:Zn-dependent M28 family amino/carboxypeptidase